MTFAKGTYRTIGLAAAIMWTACSDVNQPKAVVLPTPEERAALAARGVPSNVRVESEGEFWRVDGDIMISKSDLKVARKLDLPGDGTSSRFRNMRLSRQWLTTFRVSPYRTRVIAYVLAFERQ